MKRENKLKGRIMLLICGIVLIFMGAFAIMLGVIIWGASGLIASGTGVLSEFLSSIIPQSIMGIVDSTADTAISRVRWIGVMRVVDGGLLTTIGIVGVVYNNNSNKSKLLVVIAVVGVILAFIPLTIGVSIFRLIVLTVFLVGAILNFHRGKLGQRHPHSDD